MSRYYSKKNRYLIGLKSCQLFKLTASGSRFGFDCIINCTYKRQEIYRVKEYKEKIKLGGTYNGWSIKFRYVEKANKAVIQ